MEGKDIFETIFRLNRELYEKSQPGPPREIGNYLIFTTDVPTQAPRFDCVFDPSVQYAPRSEPGYDYSWLRHLKL